MNENYEFSPWITESSFVFSVLTEGLKPEKFKKEESLYSVCGEPEYIYLIVSGRVRITAFHASGRERQLYIAEKGCIIGETSVLLHRKHSTTATAIVDSVAYRISAATFVQRMQKDYTVCNAVMQMICKKHDILFNALLSSSFSQSLSQIAQILLNIADQYGEETADGCRISIRFTHQDIANITGISRVTVSNAFNLFAEKGLCGRINGTFCISDMEGLREYSKLDE